jgi:hypothetical protein
MRQVIATWFNEPATCGLSASGKQRTNTRLLILMDNDSRDSLQSLVFSHQTDAMKHLANLTHTWRVGGSDLDVTNVSVLNPFDEHDNWMIDFDPQTPPNARCFTLT